MKKMSDFILRGAEQKFWTTPELVLKLLETLDLRSIVVLAEATKDSEVHGIVIKVLQGAVTWRKLMMRSWGSDSHHFIIYQRFREETAIVKHLTKILLRMEKPKPLQLDLLEFICEKNRGSNMSGVSLSCTCNIGGHLVSQRGFRHLEKVEGAFASANQKIEKISVPHLGDVLLALGSRAAGVSIQT